MNLISTFKNNAEGCIIKTILLILLFGILLPLPARCEEQNTIVVACDPWPPFIDPHHPQGGLSLEIIRAAFQIQGYTIQYVDIPWARAEASVKAGDYDILPDVWKTSDRKKDLMFSIPYTTNEIVFITLKDDPFENDGIKSLKGKTVGTVRGFGYDTEFMNATHFKREEVSDFSKNLKKLLSGRIDITLEDENVARYNIAQENPRLFKQVKFSKIPLAVQGLHIAAGYKNPRHQEIIETFNNGLISIKTNGRLAEIFKKYRVHE